MRPGQRRWMAVITIKLPARTPHPRTRELLDHFDNSRTLDSLSNIQRKAGRLPRRRPALFAVFQPISRIRCMVSSNSSADSSRLLKFTLYPAPNASA